MFGLARTGAARTVSILVAALAVAVGLVGISAGPGAQPTAQAADLRGFSPGNIIDDSLFWDPNAMTVAEIQAFLNAKAPSCQAGYVCLKDYRETTRTVAATPMCGYYAGAPNETAATIIWRVAQACGISPKVILVMLQKEQGLVTHTAPSAGRYRSAMGAGCPDTAPCDAEYYGFFNQVHYGSYLLKRYTQPPGTGAGTAYTTRYDLRFPVGQVSAVLFNPNANCGTTNVYIENQATHALYIYTPYTPNAAALAAGYGTGDGCSAYGNRNFYNYYVDWFGTNRGHSVGVYFREYYAANSSWLSWASGPMTCGRPDGGCYQYFQGGIVTSSGHSYATGVRHDYIATWGNYGRELGILGYPIADRLCNDMPTGACRQQFQGGWIVSSAVGGVRVVLNEEFTTWGWWGREYGALGFPLTDRYCEAGTCFQQFQGGSTVVGPATTIQVVPTAVMTAWGWWGRQYGILGTPVAPPTVPGGTNYTQAFQGGTITVAGGVGTVTSVADPWFNAVLSNPWIGASQGAKACGLPSGGCTQTYQNGWIVSGPAGTFAVPSAVVTGWGWWGIYYGVLGYPSGAPSANPTTGNYTQAFQGGTVTVAGGVGTVTSVTDPWFNAVLTNPWLGASQGAKACGLPSGGCSQAFAGGWVVSSPAGTFAVPSAVVTGWGWWGIYYGVLGYPSGAPSANPATGNYTQAFQGGTVTVAGGVGTVTSVTDPWFNAVLTTPWLGAAQGAKTCGLPQGGCSQAFAGGWVVSGPAGTFAVPSAVVTGWGWWGIYYGVLGYPSGVPSANPATGNYTQSFQGGTVTVTGGVGTVTSVADPWFNAVLTNGWLGASLDAKTCGLPQGGCSQTFQNGWIVSSPTGTFAVPSAVVTAWGWWGIYYGDLRYPTGAPTANPPTGTYTQSFQGGTVTVTGGVGTVTATG